MTIRTHYLAIALLAGFGLALSACGGGGGAPVMEMPDPEPTPHACDAGPSQACVDARADELAALGEDATVAQVNAARAALADATAAYAVVQAAAHRAALVEAAMCTAATTECVGAHQALVDALTADPTTSISALAAAQAALNSVQTALALANDRAAAEAALQMLADAAAACTDGTQACVEANQAYVDALDEGDENLAAAQAALAAVQMAKAEADAEAARQEAARMAAAARQALVDAAACTDGTQACIDAHQALVDALLADDTTLAVDLAAAQSAMAEVVAAKAEADAAEAQRLADEAAAAARAALVNAATCSEGTQACVDAHQALVTALDEDPSTTADDLAAAQADLALVVAAKQTADDAEAARLAAEEAERMRLAARQALIDEADCTEGTAACVAAHEALVEALVADETTSEEDLNVALANLAIVGLAKAEADAMAARQVLVDAAMCSEGTQACLDAHNALVAALDADSSTSADDLQAAQAARDNVQTAFDANEAARMARETRQAAMDAAMCTDATEACVAAHDEWITILEAELADVQADDDATNAQVALAQAAVNSATMARDTVQTAIDDANAAAMALADARMAVSDAQTAVAGLEADASQDEVDAADALVMAARTAVNALDDAGELEGQVAALESTIMGHNDRIDMAEEAARVVAATDAAETKRTEIAAEAAQTLDAGLGGSDAPPSGDGAYTLAIMWDDETDAQSVTISVEDGVAGPSDGDVSFKDEMAGLDGGRHMLTRTHKAGTDGSVMTEVAIVATDLEGPEPVDFAKFKVVAVDGGETFPQALDAYDLDDAVDADGDGTATNDWTALGIATGNLGNVKAGAFTAPAGTLDSATVQLTFQHMVADDTGTTDVDESRDAAQIAGTFNGAMGIYRCNSTSACTVTVNTKGVVSAVSATTTNDWVFIPDAGATSDQPDYDYYHYGFWLKLTDDKDGVRTYNEVETFAGSRIDASTGSELNAVRGSASYEGSAVGVYVRETYDPEDGSVDTATSGHFKAEASLTATFGQVHEGDDPGDTSKQGTLAPNVMNTVTGRIHSFELQHGEANQWVVHLDGSRTDGANTFSGSAKGGGAVDGEFSGTFHGLTPAIADVTNTNTAPGSMVGEFDANFGNGAVAGAFGARKAE